MEQPEGGTGWKLVELRPVSEGSVTVLLLVPQFLTRVVPFTYVEFADPPPPPPDLSHLSISSPIQAPQEPEPIVPTENPPQTLIEWAVCILNTADPMLKACPLSTRVYFLLR